jgi:methyl-accepting chemotaxis protein
MFRRFNIQKKLLIPILLWIALVLVLSAAFTIGYTRKLAREKVETESLGLIRLNASAIRDFFVERSRIVRTLYRNPFLLGFFQTFDRRGIPLAGNPDYPRITQTFRDLVDADSTVASVFFAVNATGEYFDEGGRYADPAYSAKNRTWWKNSIAQNRLYCARADYDLVDSIITSTMEMPVRLPDGRLLGIGGIDILITTVDAIVGRMRYKGRGNAFLLDEGGRLIHFPGLPAERSIATVLASIDTLSQGASGFAALAVRMERGGEGMARVRWQGEEQIALFAPVLAEVPFIDWKLGMLVPTDLIDGPVRRITLLSFGVVLLSMAGVFALTVRTVTKTVKPLDALAQRLDGMAGNRCDLTQSLPVETNDVIGATARNFNAFLDHLRTVLSGVIGHARDLVQRMAHLHRQSESISEGAKRMSRQAQLAAVTADQTMRTLAEIKRDVNRVVQMSAESERSVVQGETIVRERLERMRGIHDSIRGIADEMEKLGLVSEEVIRAVDLVKEINEQIAILSINASIEAVRAGEAGQAFGVVADEIKGLNDSTARANTGMASTIQAYQKRLKDLHLQIDAIRDRIAEEFDASERLSREFDSVLAAVTGTTGAADDMQRQTLQQADALTQINQNIVGISEAIDQIAQGILESFSAITVVNERMQELGASAEQFKVE